MTLHSDIKPYTRLLLCECENSDIEYSCMECNSRPQDMTKDEFYNYFYQIRDKCKTMTVNDRCLQKKYAALRRMEKNLINIPCECVYDRKCIYCSFLGSIGDL